jgi:hypothetical protein
MSGGWRMRAKNIRRSVIDASYCPKNEHLLSVAAGFAASAATCGSPSESNCPAFLADRPDDRRHLLSGQAPKRRASNWSKTRWRPECERGVGTEAISRRPGRPRSLAAKRRARAARFPDGAAAWYSGANITFPSGLGPLDGDRDPRGRYPAGSGKRPRPWPRPEAGAPRAEDIKSSSTNEAPSNLQGSAITLSFQHVLARAMSGRKR